MSPEPDASSSDGARVVWRFDKPESSVFTFEIDGELHPSTKPGWIDGRTEIFVGTDRVSTLDYRTWIWP
jgi:hypothetical protein